VPLALVFYQIYPEPRRYVIEVFLICYVLFSTGTAFPLMEKSVSNSHRTAARDRSPEDTLFLTGSTWLDQIQHLHVISFSVCAAHI